MIITCPKCFTHYSVDPGAIGAEGRDVRCSNCGHQWMQSSVSETEPLQAVAPTPVIPDPPMSDRRAPEPVSHSAPTAADPGFSSPGQDFDTAEDLPQSEDFQATESPAIVSEPQVPLEAEGDLNTLDGPGPIEDAVTISGTNNALDQENTAAVETPIDGRLDNEDLEKNQTEDVISAPEADGELEPATDERPGGATEPEPKLGDGDLVANNFEQDHDYQPLKSEEKEADALIIGGEDRNEPQGVETPEPIPQALIEPQIGEDERGSGNRGLVIAIVCLLLIGGAVGGLIFGKDFVVKQYPPAEDYYKLIGIGGNSVGDGLRIRNEQAEWDQETGALKITGLVSNVTEDERDVPLIEIVFTDINGERIQSLVVEPDSNKLPPLENLPFEATLENPDGRARKMDIILIERPAE